MSIKDTKKSSLFGDLVEKEKKELKNNVKCELKNEIKSEIKNDIKNRKKKSTNKLTTTVRVDRDLWNQAADLCYEDGYSLNEVIKQLVRYYVDEKLAGRDLELGKRVL